MEDDKKQSWVKNNIFSLIALTSTIIGLISAGSIMIYQLKDVIKDVDELKKEVKMIENVGDLRKAIDDKVFSMKTDVYKEIEKIDLLFKEKLLNSEKREQELRSDIKELRDAIYKLKYK